jgi:hypothetical protein
MRGAPRPLSGATFRRRVDVRSGPADPGDRLAYPSSESTAVRCLAAVRVRITVEECCIPYTGRTIPYTEWTISYTGRSIPYEGRTIPYTGQAISYTGRTVPYTGCSIPWTGWTIPPAERTTHSTGRVPVPKVAVRRNLWLRRDLWHPRGAGVHRVY